jgi:protein TonB
MAGIARDPATTPLQSCAPEFGLGRFAAVSGLRAELRENFSELFRAGARGAVRSGLLVAWESRPANFRRNLRDAIVSSVFDSIASDLVSSEVPEIWSKRTLLKRVQSLSLSYHIVLLVFVIAPFLPELMAPSTTHARSGPWVRTRLIAPPDLAPALVIKPPRGGGSGGDRNPLPATTGRVPPFRHIQLAPPSAKPPVNPALSVPTTLIGAPELQVQSLNMPNWGDPKSLLRNDSNGPGYGGGIGNNTGGGIGDDGKGPGYGPGNDGGTGEGNNNDGARVSAYPICVYCPNPQYSEEAVKTKYQGSVLLSVTITADGRVTNIRIAKGLGAGLDEKAIEAVRTWRFRPGLGSDHQPVTVTAPIEVTFRLY